MVTYISLAKFTDHGIRMVKETTKRADLFKEMASKFGVKVTGMYWTHVAYDVVTICEANDDASFAAFNLYIGGSGNVRLEPMKAYNREEMAQILSRIP